MAHMDVLLKEDVENLGQRGQVVRVRAGYGRNYLLPQKLAIKASAGNRRMIEEQQRVLAKREQREKQSAQGEASKLDGLELRVERRVGARHLEGESGAPCPELHYRDRTLERGRDDLGGRRALAPGDEPDLLGPQHHACRTFAVMPDPNQSARSGANTRIGIACAATMYGESTRSASGNRAST